MAAAVVNRAAADFPAPAMVAAAGAASAVNLPVSEGRPAALPVSERADTGNTGNLSNDLLAILANKEIDNERFDPGEWRIEVYTNRNGIRYWNHRRRGKRGGKANWRFGGRFETLSAERQEEYWQRSKG